MNNMQTPPGIGPRPALPARRPAPRTSGMTPDRIFFGALVLALCLAVFIVMIGAG